MHAVSLDELSTEELSAAANANFVMHAGWVQQRAAGMYVDAAQDLVLVDSGLPCDTFNFVCRARFDSSDSPARIRAAIDHFVKVGRPFSWWLSPGDQPADLGEMLRAAGLQEAETEVAMAADLERLRLVELAPGGLQIERVRTTAQLHDFARVVAANWTPPDPEVLHFFDLAAPLVLRRDCPLWLYVGHVNGEAVATAELTVGGGVVGLYNICTLEEHRRQGYGSAMTLQPLLDARAQGYHTGVLQAAVMGAGIYRRAGFEAFGEITEYKPA